MRLQPSPRTGKAVPSDAEFTLHHRRISNGNIIGEPRRFAALQPKTAPLLLQLLTRGGIEIIRARGETIYSESCKESTFVLGSLADLQNSDNQSTSSLSAAAPPA